jgi:hypothetical protein
VQIEDIRYLLGHGAKSITERYAHASLDVLREAVATLDRKIENQNRNKNRNTRCFEDSRFLGDPRISLNCFEMFGGREGIRTPGLLVANEALSQLSYSPTSSEEILAEVGGDAN